VYLIVAYLIFYFFGLLISARKWQLLAQFKKFKNKYLFYFKSYLLGTFLNNFFPSFVGGDTYRVYSLGKPVKKISESSTTIVADRVSGLVGIMILSIIFAALNYNILIHHNIIVIVILILIIITIGIVMTVLFFNKKFIQYFINFLPQFVQKYIQQLAQFRDSRISIKTLLYSFLFAFAGIAIANYLLFMAIGVELEFYDFMSVIFLSSIIAAVPISVGNIGVKEWAYVFLFGIFGVNPNAAVTVVILSRVLQMLVSLIAVPFYLQNKKTLQHK
ncbi:MAG: lysylphosphatidylglycerol synthase transmembrane domain-containing protein, partial [Patescibacteria group bacterium]|nr:lysylphosphatidylglycerol synthase transmembrane domain-containing protein [Patescibacteria group bacterium]